MQGLPANQSGPRGKRVAMSQKKKKNNNVESNCFDNAHQPLVLAGRKP